MAWVSNAVRRCGGAGARVALAGRASSLAGVAAPSKSLHERLRAVAGAPRQLPALSSAGGVTAAAFLLLSALTYRTLAEPAVARDPALAHALLVFSYLAGGPAIGVPLALPIMAVSILAIRDIMLRPAIGWLGISAAVVGLLSSAVVLGPMNNSSATYGLLLLSAILAFLWVFVTSVLLTNEAGRAADSSH